MNGGSLYSGLKFFVALLKRAHSRVREHIISSYRSLVNEIQQKILKTSDISGSQRPQEASRPATVPFRDCVWEDVFVTPMV